MARITVEDCLKKVNNRFTIIHMAAKRVRQYKKGMEPAIVTKNKDIVTALREIAAGKIVPVKREEGSEVEKPDISLIENFSPAQITSSRENPPEEGKKKE